MKKINLIYNPNSGNKFFKNELDFCVKKFQSKGYLVNLFRLGNVKDIDHYFNCVRKDDCDAFVISGGDGTINLVVNAIMKYGLNNIPIGIIPSGTANDFATFLNLPKKVEEACKIIVDNNVMSVDIGIANDKYFVNVCAGGLFANVGQKINKDAKETFGKISYYVKAIEEMSHCSPIKLRIKNSKEIIEGDFYLFLILNSTGTGGIEKISPNSSINDGVFDFVAFKNINLTKIPSLALKFLKGDHLEDDGVVFFRDNEIFIENLSNECIQTDLDGEVGPSVPVKIKNITKCINVFYNANK